MIKYVTFLRGINVGGRVIKMADLKNCFEKAGLKEVMTVLQSGNVLFESELAEPELKQKIEAALIKSFNYPAKVQVISAKKLEKIIQKYPFKAREGFHSYVIFLEKNLEKELIDEPVEFDPQKEKAKEGLGVVYWQVERGQTLKSSFAKQLSKAKYKAFNTTRNLNTLRKLI